MVREGTPGLEDTRMPLADVVAMCASAMGLLAGACSIWNPAWFERIPHWVTVFVLGSAMVVALALVVQDRRLRARAPELRMRIRISNAAWGITVLAEFMVLGLRALSMVNQEKIALAVMIIAVVQVLSAAGLWVHWILTRNRRFAS